MSSAICFNLNQSKILSSGNGLKHRTLCGMTTLLVALLIIERLIAYCMSERYKPINLEKQAIQE